MEPFWADQPANASSVHSAGRLAFSALEDARSAVARAVGACAGEILFTSGTTESNALALIGSALHARNGSSARRQIVVSAIEHKAILNHRQLLQELDFKVSIVPVTPAGIIDLDKLQSVVGDNTLLISVQTVNNVLGTIQPLEEVVRLANQVGARVHTDAAQALGKLPVDVRGWGVDMASFSAHKIYGPKGVGALYMKGGSRKAMLRPLLAGGGQESGLRPGTANVPGVVGFGRACRIVEERRAVDWAQCKRVREFVEERLKGSGDPCVSILCEATERVPTCTAARIHEVEADALCTRLPRIAFSTGSACESGAPEPSHVFNAIGLGRAEAYECVRLSYGRNTELTDASTALDAILEEARAIKAVVIV